MTFQNLLPKRSIFSILNSSLIITKCSPQFSTFYTPQAPFHFSTSIRIKSWTNCTILLWWKLSKISVFSPQRTQHTAADRHIDGFECQNAFLPRSNTIHSSHYNISGPNRVFFFHVPLSNAMQYIIPTWDAEQSSHLRRRNRKEKLKAK